MNNIENLLSEDEIMVLNITGYTYILDIPYETDEWNKLYNEAIQYKELYISSLYNYSTDLLYKSLLYNELINILNKIKQYIN